MQGACTVIGNLEKGKSKVKNQTFTASIWQEDDWFIAQCLEVDIASQGESEEAALDNLIEALELSFESPQPSLKNFKECLLK